MSNELQDRGNEEMKQRSKKITVFDEVLSTKGRGKVFLKLFGMAAVVCVIAEIIGVVSIPIGRGKIVILPSIFALIMTVLISPDVLGRKIKVFKTFYGESEVKLSESSLMLVLLMLGAKLGMAAGPNILKIIAAGPAFVLQEFGNLGTMLIGLPIAMMLGMKREAVGSTVSICREPTLGLITETYGIDSPEGIGVMGTYMVGNIFGILAFGLIGSFAPLTGIHPYALGMACGIGSGTMMTASSQALAETIPEMADDILAFAATSNVMTNVTGLYMILFISLPIANFIYKCLSKVFKDKVKVNQ